eukprot:TRINITY_DN2030_c0_g1_i2.p1 TRINITY_DN2030_c0_g1~~TRINITY_DN2030_c0_g1_i2.p1  ORF type:complete len:411 (+),score=87.84 TRINITY_DN2030_c0_g1_i2:124-1356(+)
MALPTPSMMNQQVQAVDQILYKLRSYRNPQKVRTDVLELMRNYPSLQVRAGTAPGVPTQAQSLYLAGTVPIFYNGVQYNIPVNLWVADNYPFIPPTCYVTPTSDMIIKPKHRHVDSQGICYLPYLSSWNATACNLVGLVSTMSQIFGQDPPVRSQTSKPSNPAPSPAMGNNMSNPSPVPTPYGQQNSQYPQNGSQYNNTPIPPPGTQQNYPYGTSYPPQQQPGPQFSTPPPPTFSSSQPFEDPSVVAKRNAVRSATEKTQGKLQEFFSTTTKEIDNLIAENGRLEDRVRHSAIEKQQLDIQQTQASSDIESMTKSFDDITRWLEANDQSADIDIDAVTEPKDPLSKQLLYLVAEDATIEDTLYYLEKNLMSGELNLDVFLKNIRSLTTEQFLKRATIKRIHERQRSQSVK